MTERYAEKFLQDAIIFLHEGNVFRASYVKNEFGRKSTVTCAGVEYELVPVADLKTIYSRITEDLSDEITGAGDAKLSDLRRQTTHLDRDRALYRDFIFSDLLPKLGKNMGILEIDDAYKSQFPGFEIKGGTYVYVETGDYAIFNVDNPSAKECYEFKSTKIGMRLECSNGSVRAATPTNLEPYKNPFFHPDSVNKGATLCIGNMVSTDDEAKNKPIVDQIVERLEIYAEILTDGYTVDHNTPFKKLEPLYYPNQIISLQEAYSRKLPIGNVSKAEIQRCLQGGR